MPVKLWKTLGRKTLRSQKKDARKASENAQEAPRGTKGDWNE